MKTEHTPGPWKVRFFRDGDPNQGFFVEANKTNPDAGYDIEILSDDLGYYPLDQRLADAHLVAAAPELLKALELAKVDLIAMGMDVGHNHMLKIDTALEKAKGKSQ